MFTLSNKYLRFCCLRLALTPNGPSRRQQEFLAGRQAAKKALTKLSPKNISNVRRGPKGEPMWPKGLVGSITHAGPIVAAAVAKKNKVLALGIDIENLHRTFNSAILKRIANETELTWAAKKWRALLLFSAKESIYKALYPEVKKYFGFKAVELNWSRGNTSRSGALTATLTTNLSPRFCEGYRLKVAYKIKAGYLLTYVIIRTPRKAK